MLQAFRAALLLAFVGTWAVPAAAQDVPAPVKDVSAVAQDTGHATVYVYRQKKFGGSALEPAVYVDDKKVAEMDNGRYFAIKLPAGEHVIRSTEKDAIIDQEWKAGQVYFVKLTIATGMMKGRGAVAPASEKQGRNEIAKLKLLDANKVDQAAGDMVILEPITMK